MGGRARAGGRDRRDLLRDRPDRRQRRRRRRAPKRHESWFAALLEDPKRADDFVRHHLPSEIVEELDDTLPEALAEGFATPRLGQRVSDHVYRLGIKVRHGRSELLLHLEHRSTIDKTMAVRTQNYQSLLRLRVAGRNSRKVPLVLSLVAYHGHRPWNAGLSLSELIPTAGAVGKSQDAHRYLLSDLPRMKERALAADPVLRAGLLLMIYACRDRRVTAAEVARALAPFPYESELERRALL